MTASEELLNLIKNNTQMVAMLAPSFPIVYEYPQIISKLKNIGFSYVVEVTIGAKRTNEMTLELIKRNPNQRYITSPCPSIVRLIKTKFPFLKKYLTFEADSPMIATAKIVQNKYPGYKPVFIGPCISKKFEAKEDYPDLDILVLTYKELNEVFKQLNATDNENNSSCEFDLSEIQTRIYPLDAGLTTSCGMKDIIDPSQTQVISGWKNCEKALSEFENNKNIRLLDILFCEQGCIFGPGINSNLTASERIEKIKKFSQL